MKVMSRLFQDGKFVRTMNTDQVDPKLCQLLIGFGSKRLVADEENFRMIQGDFPNAQIVLCSTSGEINDSSVFDDTISIIGIEFEKTQIVTHSIEVSEVDSSLIAGIKLIEKFDKADLKYVFVLSDGGLVNGSELVKGMESVIEHTVPITGGLAGDGSDFKSTLVGLNAKPSQGNIVAVGFYGNAIQIGHGSMGGWEMFGLERTVTRSEANVLFDIDNKNALELYKDYLGKYTNELPGSALLFPLSVILSEGKEPIVRTILSIDSINGTMTFAGDIPEGSRVRFMKANFDNLISAASVAAKKTHITLNVDQAKLALLISCVGRKVILGNRIDEEVEAVKEVFGNNTVISGFYSYGELSPMNPNSSCELHNQTMTITTFNEI